MSEPTRRELVIEARRTFGETPARELAVHLLVPFDACLPDADALASGHKVSRKR